MVSANKIYRESGSSLPFKDWLEREKNKGNFIPNAQAYKEFKNFDGQENTTSPTTTNDVVLRNTLIVVGLVLGIALFYKYTKYELK